MAAPLPIVMELKFGSDHVQDIKTYVKRAGRAQMEMTDSPAWHAPFLFGG